MGAHLQTNRNWENNITWKEQDEEKWWGYTDNSSIFRYCLKTDEPQSDLLLFSDGETGQSSTEGAKYFENMVHHDLESWFSTSLWKCTYKICNDYLYAYGKSHFCRIKEMQQQIFQVLTMCNWSFAIYYFKGYLLAVCSVELGFLSVNSGLAVARSDFYRLLMLLWVWSHMSLRFAQKLTHRSPNS